jgi:hypothetical protein
MNAHSSILGGSNAARLLACPASYAEQLKSPLIDVESSYAAEGTALHAAIANCIESKVKPEHILGATFYGHEIDEKRVEILCTALDKLDDLLGAYGNPKRFRIVGVEETLPLPGVTGAFGSVDLVLADKRTVVVVDWKFGQGVPVKALYTDATGDQLNPQLAFYAAAARHAYKRRFRGKQIVLAIIQPRLDYALDYVETDDAELDQFLDAFYHAYSEALGRDAHRERGEHCRFAPCKATCPLWTGPLFDLAVIDPGKAALKASVDVTGYGGFLSNALQLAEFAETWAEEIRKQGHVFLEDGGKIPGWKLVPKRATRKWLDEEHTPAALEKLGANVSDIFSAPELRSVAQVEKALKKRGIALDEQLYQAVSSGTTIVHADDFRPDATHATVTVELRQALKAL